MAQEQVTFIDREAELEHIRESVTEWNTRRVLCIQAGGGIGKTRLLHEVHDRWRERGTARLAITEVLTFDDLALHMPEALRHRLTEMLGRDTFEPYSQRRLDYRKMVRIGLSKTRLEQEREAVLETFRNCLRASLSGRRGVILLDTTDALQEGGSTWDYIVNDLVLQPCNVLFLIAGRNAQLMHEQLVPQIGEDAQLLNLPPLGVEASKQYLLARQKQLHSTIDPEIAQKLLLLTQGRPIFIDLAVDWLAHKHPLLWLEGKSLEEIQGLPPEQVEIYREEFEHSLVRRVVDLRTNMDRLLLLLSHVYPLNDSLAGQLLGLGKKNATDIVEEARSYISIKQLPAGWISLHDEVRRLLNEIEAEIDPEGMRKRSDNLKAAMRFEATVLDLKKELLALEQEEREAHAEGREREEFEATVRYTDLQREYWVAAGHWLHHKLCVMPSEGVDIFKRLFDEATDAYQFSARGGFVEQIMQVFDELNPLQQHEVNIRRATHLFDQAEYATAREVLGKMLEDDTLLPYQQVDIFSRLGNVEIRLGNLKAGNECFDRAAKISNEQGMKQWQARAELALGWGKRLIGHLTEAIDHYRISYRLSIEVGDRVSEAWSLNNLAFANALLGRWTEALPLCRQAEELWEALGNKRGLGALHEVYGVAYTRAGDYQRAQSHFQDALEIFEVNEDTEWLCRIYAGQGIAYRFAGDLDASEQALKRAAALDVPQFKVQILHSQAHIHLLRGDKEQATKLLNESYEESRRAGDTGYELNNLADLAELAVEDEEYDRLEEFEDKYAAFKEFWPDVNFYRAEGLLLVQLGKLAMGAHPDDPAHAARYFAQGFPYLAEYAALEAYTVQTQLKELDEYFIKHDTPPTTVAHIGKQLYQTWEKKALDIRHPEALSYIIRWKQRNDTDNRDQ